MGEGSWRETDVQKVFVFFVVKRGRWDEEEKGEQEKRRVIRGTSGNLS